MKLVAIEIAVAKNLGQEPWADCLPRMHGDDRGSPIRVAKKVVTSLDSRHLESSLPQRGKQILA